MPTFNLFEYRQAQAAIPNGQSVSVVPNGAGMGESEQGMMLSDGNPGGVAGEGSKQELREIIGDILKAEADQESESEIGRIARRAMNIGLPDELNGNDNAMQLVIALGRRAMENQEIATTDPETGNAEKSLAELAGMIADEAGWDREELIMQSELRSDDAGGMPGPDGGFGDAGGTGGIPPVATAGFLAAARMLFAGKGVKNPLQKKKKGNPFKVLMGRVQKLLDHGIDERNQVVRTLMRQKGNRWKRETIEKAFTLVKDRNVRDERTKQNEEATEMPKAASFNMAEYLGMRRQAENEKPEKEIPDVRTEQRESLYSVDRPMSSLSMGELISRLQYLVTAVNSENTMMGENLVAYRGVDKSAMSKQADAIKAELTNRGYDADMLKRLFGIPNATKPSTNYQGEKQPEPSKSKKPEPGREVV